MQASSERAIPECGFARNFPMWVKSEVCFVQACLAAPSHPYLVIYSYDLDVRGLSVVRLYPTCTQQAALIMFVYLIYEVYI